MRNEATGAAMKEIQREMRRLQTEPVPAQELVETQRYLSGSYLVGLQTQSALVGTLARNWVVDDAAVAPQLQPLGRFEVIKP